MKKRIFSGDDSIRLWDEIDNAKTISQLRSALYVMACRCQELEAVVYSLKQKSKRKKRKKDTSDWKHVREMCS